MSNKNKDKLVIGIDIRNIGKKRTGDEVVFLNLVRNFQFLDSKQFSIFNNVKFEFLLFTDIEDRGVLKKIEKKMGIINNDNFKIISLKIPKKGGKFFWNFWMLPVYLRKHPIDIYHTQYITPFFVSRKIKIITHIHDVSFKAYKQFIKWSDLFFLNILIPLSIRRANKVITVSNFTKNEIAKYYPQARGKTEVVYNAITYNKPETKKLKNYYKLQAKYKLPKKYILYIGTLQPRKNIPTLIDAYLRITEKIPDIKLVIAGNLKAHNIDKKLIKCFQDKNLQSKVYFPGFIDEKDKMTLLANATVFVYPSFYEGFGIPPLEAMSVNVPTVISDISPHREVTEKASIYFNSRSVDELAKKVYTVCMDKKLRVKLVSLGQTRFKFFSWQKSAKKMLRIYKNL